jgi:D-alanyl-D-alanine carboxypeptidase
MNRNCVRNGLKSSFFDSPHGLMNPVSRSTAFDIAKLCAICMEMPTFRQIVSTKYFKVMKNN